MLISYNWLKEFVNLPDSLTPKEVALKLTMSTVEVEKVEKQCAFLDKIVVGKVISAEKHPDADKLKVCKVDIGSEQLQVVCGGSNVRVSMLVALGKVGAKVKWHGEGELVELKPTTIRGVESFGMICASTEIGLEEMFPLKNEKEILDLSDYLTPGPSPYKGEGNIGKSFAEVLGLNDVIFEIDNKSITNRPDLWGHYGIAREVAALFKKELKAYPIKNIKKQDTKKLQINVEDKKLCPRYMAVAIGGVKVAPSPVWLQAKIRAVGLRPINNIVDITNYVMYDLGQPMHAFDNSKLSAQGASASGGKNSKVQIVVRRAEDGEKFVTLDEKEHVLTNEDLLIATEEKAVALAGVMGGLESGISEATDTIVFESANFDASSIRKTSIRLGLRTDSSARFEKSLDPNLCELALQKAIGMTLELCPNAYLSSKIVDEKNFHLATGPINLDWEFLDKKIGVKIGHKEIVGILKQLGFEIKENKGGLSVKIPTWRATKDISIPEDLVEEVARIFGYDNIKTCLPMFPITPPEQNQLRLLERKIKDLLVLEHNFSETYNYSFVSPKLSEKCDIDFADLIELDNPIAKDRPYLRVSLLPGLLENTEKNIHFVDNIRLFEIGKIFEKNKPGMRTRTNSDELLPRQRTMLGVVYTAKDDKMPFYEVSEAINGILNKLRIKYDLVSQKDEKTEKFIHPSRQAVIKVGDDIVGIMAELHPSIQQSFGIEGRVAMVEIGLDNLLTHISDRSDYQKIAQYPAVMRDVAFVIDKNVQHAEIVSSLRTLDPLICAVKLFDVFSGVNIGEDKKSLAYHITYRSDNKTLESEEVDKVHHKVVDAVEKIGGKVRK